jgi:hypothetical protein
MVLLRVEEILISDYAIHFKMDEQEDSTENTKPEPADYYMENGFVVFTKEFLLKRGYCCESGCRHCPYGFTPHE